LTTTPTLDADAQTDAPVQLVAVEWLHASTENPRRITASKLEQLQRSLVDDPLMLYARPIIALVDGTIIAGEMRWRAATALGLVEIPAVVVDLDRERARVWMLRDNQSYGEWDVPTLSDLLRELDASHVDLDLTGFGERELHRLLESLEPDTSAQLGATTYSLLIDVESESEQIALATRLEQDGFTVKLLMA
jgi:ParB-like chromosome segregation protein Spo0J